MTGAPLEPSFRLLGLTIVRKTDLLAATAFLLALGTTLYQLWGFARGADVTLYPPDRVVLFFDELADGRTIIRLAGDMTLINSGQPGRDAVLRDIDATLAIDGKPVSRQRWVSFARLERDGTALTVAAVTSAHPLAVAGGSTVSQTVSFSPLPEGCGGTLPCAANFVDWRDFTGRLLRGQVLRIGFEARVFGGRRPLTARCDVAISEALTFNLTANGWHSAACTEPAAR